MDMLRPKTMRTEESVHPVEFSPLGGEENASSI
jgi:hypothetical protein